jgi:hypothetical protein
MDENGTLDLTDSLSFSNQVITGLADVTRRLMSKDNIYIPNASVVSARRDILSLLAEKSSSSLQSLRISIDSHKSDYDPDLNPNQRGKHNKYSFYWRSDFKLLTTLNFVNLQQLEVYMGSPLEVFHVISVLPVLKQIYMESQL